MGNQYPREKDIPGSFGVNNPGREKENFVRYLFLWRQKNLGFWQSSLTAPESSLGRNVPVSRGVGYLASALTHPQIHFGPEHWWSCWGTDTLKTEISLRFILRM